MDGIDVNTGGMDNNMQEEIMVSVSCMVYNHAKYLRQCLDSLVSQEVDFKYEIIIHDDASTDDSAVIINEYARRYPNLIIPIIQTENQYSQLVKISKQFILPKIRGKYIALCEGDDFWTDKKKLQKQVAALEKNRDCHLCVHTVGTCREDGTRLLETMPAGFEGTPRKIDSKTFVRMVSEKYAFHTSSYFFRAEEYIAYQNADLKFVRVSPVGDQCLMYYFGNLGNVYYIQDEMSCYRKFAIGSWTSRNRDLSNKINNHLGLIRMEEEYDVYTDYKYHDILQKRRLFHYYVIHEAKHEYRELLKPEFREWFTGETFKYKAFIVMCAYFPGFRKVYKKYRDKKWIINE